MVKKATDKKKAAADDDAGPIAITATGEANHRPVVLEHDSERWVTLKLRLINWHFTDFEVRTKTSMYLFTLKKMIQERHGAISHLVMCKHTYQAENEMPDETKTLADYGIEGVPKGQLVEEGDNAFGSAAAVVSIFYDFKPALHEPLLLEP